MNTLQRFEHSREPRAIIKYNQTFTVYRHATLISMDATDKQDQFRTTTKRGNERFELLINIYDCVCMCVLYMWGTYLALLYNSSSTALKAAPSKSSYTPLAASIRSEVFLSWQFD